MSLPTPLTAGLFALFLVTAPAASADQGNPKPLEKYCRFRVPLVLLNQVNAGNYSYFTGNYFWTSSDSRLRTTKPGGDSCEVAIASNSRGRFPMDQWVWLQTFNEVHQEFAGRYVAKGSLYLSGDPLHDPGTISCVRESEAAMPEEFTQAEILAKAAKIVECHDEPRFENLEPTLRECKLLANHWSVDLRLGRPIAEDKLRWLQTELKARSEEYAAKCPELLRVPGCGSARVVLRCLEELNALIQPKGK